MKKYSLILIIAAAILLEVMGAAQYFLATYGTEAELLDKATRDMNESLRVGAVKSEVESALHIVYGEVESSIDNPDDCYSIANKVVLHDKHIVGAGVAYRPDYFKAQGKARLYAPYVYDQQPDVTLKKKKTVSPKVVSVLLPFDYTERDWFKKPLANGKSMWTNPYLDKGGTHIIMCTYVMPVHNKAGDRVAVFFADVPMEDVSLLSMNIHQGIADSRTVILIIQLVSLAIIGFIVWLAVRAFRRYKGQYIDPEKPQLIEKIEKLRKVNARLTKRNHELAQKVSKLEDNKSNNTTTTGFTYDTSW